MRTTKIVIGIKLLSYKDRLKRLKLPALKYMRTGSDMIQVYKIGLLINEYLMST